MEVMLLQEEIILALSKAIQEILAAEVRAIHPPQVTFFMCFSRRIQTKYEKNQI